MSCPTYIRDIGYLPVVDQAACIRCFACVKACRYEVLTASKEGPAVARPDRCVDCRACVKACGPHEAIHVTSGADADAVAGVRVTQEGRSDARNYARYGRDRTTGTPLPL